MADATVEARNTVRALEGLRAMFGLDVNEFVAWFNQQLPAEFYASPDKYRRWVRGRSTKTYFVQHRTRGLCWYLGLRYDDLLRGSVEHSSVAQLQAALMQADPSTHDTREPGQIPRAYRFFYVYAVDPAYPDDLRKIAGVLAYDLAHARDLFNAQYPHLTVESIAPLLSVEHVVMFA